MTKGSRAQTIGGAIAVMAFVSACTVGPDFHSPAPAAQTGFGTRTLGRAATGDVQQAIAPETQVRNDWWALLGSPKLDAVVQEALARNWDLTSRQEALERARQELAGVRGENYPSIAAQGQIGQTRLGATVLGPSAYAFPIFSAYGAGLSASYDPDLFGGRRRRVEAAGAQVDVAVHERDAATLTLVGNVALQSIQVAAARRDYELAEAIIASDEHTLDLVRQAHEAGAAPNTDVVQASAQLDHDRTLLPAYRETMAVAEDALATLVGRSPADWSAPEFTLSEFSLPAALPSAMPSDLARHRPDILAAEARLHTASAEVGVATADLYPKVDLTAAVSREGLFGGPAETAWSLIGGAAAPIFNGGQLLSRKRAAEASYRASFADYQEVVVSALGQVADSLNALSDDADTEAAQEAALAAAQRALTLNQQGYAAGSADLVRLLDAQRLVDEAETGLVAARAARLADTVKLFMALGLEPPPTMLGEHH